MSWQRFETPIGFVRKKGGAHFVWALLAIHAHAALYHHFIRSDNVLRRRYPMKLK